MTLPPGTIVSPFDAGPHPGGMKKSRRSSAAPSLAEIGSEDRSRHDLPRHKKRHPRKASLMNRYFLHISLRSEEHKSELQSLMRISYAVFCLKKKKDNQ